MTAFATPHELREFMEIQGVTGRKSDDSLQLLLDASADWLERATGRTIRASASNTTKVFSTNGAASVTIPDLRQATSVSLQGAPLVADESFWLQPSRQEPTVATGIQLRAWGYGQGGYSYLGNPEWFERNLDRLGVRGALPNDLSITGLWGWTTVPAGWKLANIALAAYHYHHADALFASARATPEGNLLDLSAYPTEVTALVREWSIGGEIVVV